MSVDIARTTDLISEQSVHIESLRQEVGKVLVGQEKLVDNMLIALIAGGHILLEGVPGLAKTTAVKTLAGALGLTFHRISFTPDLLPADVLGTMIYSPKDGTFSAKKGPVFTNLLLADEINRAPAKVQSALLEAMEERQITAGKTSYPLEQPFFVIATQNSIEHEGTWELPQAQLDRFLLHVAINYPESVAEREILDLAMREAAAEGWAAPPHLITKPELAEARRAVLAVHVARVHDLDLTSGSLRGAGAEGRSASIAGGGLPSGCLAPSSCSPRRSVASRWRDCCPSPPGGSGRQLVGW